MTDQHEYRAKWKDGPPISQVAKLVIAAMAGDEEAKKQLEEMGYEV